MATLVLTTIGGIVGGPLGAAIGSVIGNAVDRDVLFKPKGREGPRLSDLRIQTSSYGTQLPQLFGTMRVAGCVIWSTDLIESRSKSHSGKGQPSTTTYSYAASFAVALSTRPIVGVGRIWADGKLLRGAAGDFKSATGFRLHLGGEGQAADPLIASAEGIATTPAHRGIAYAVFETLQLADFGNRIPSLTFEVVADPNPPTVGAIAEAVAQGEVAAPGVGPAILGFSAAGDDARGVLETLAVAAGGRFGPLGSGVRMIADRTAERELGDDGVAAGTTGQARGRRSTAALETVPRSIQLVHYDPDRDYQTGLQRARRPGPGRREDRIELPAVLNAGDAKSMAEAILARGEAEREKRTITTGWHSLTAAPGQGVTIAGEPGRWRIADWKLENMVLTLGCVRLALASAPAAGASSGRAVAAPDLAAGTTVIEIIEMLPLDDQPLAVPRLLIAAAGTAPGWRRAALLVSGDGGLRWDNAGATAAPAVIGRLAGMPRPAGTTLIDRRSIVEVDLLHPGMELFDADPAAIDAGANLAMLGEELIQFEQAEPLGGVRWRLSGLLRGRRGTEPAVAGHAIGDRFVAIERDTLATIDLPAGVIGAPVEVLASGVGDGSGPARAGRAITGASMLPPAPVRLAAEHTAAGATIVRWLRRSRSGWRWSDGVDAPLGEETERYRVTIDRPDGASSQVEVSEPSLVLAAPGLAVGTTLTVRQIGAHGLSLPTATIVAG